MAWSAKPIVSDVGKEFNREVTGSRDTSSAPGLFAEAYWNGGWLGVALACLIVGFILGMFSRFAARAISRGDFLLLPVIFIGIKAGYRPDGWAVIEYAGAPGLALILLGALLLTRAILVAIRPGRGRSPLPTVVGASILERSQVSLR